MSKYSELRDRISNSETLRDCRLVVPPAATDRQLLLVHSENYLKKVVDGTLSDIEIRRLGFPWSDKMVERSRRSTGASIAAGRSALRNKLSGNLAGGTHHSFPDCGQGFCVFNDVCVAIKVLQTENLIRTALIVDCDVHQGNGTAAIAKWDPSIFAFSMHCDKNYPFRKTAGDLDVALPEKSTDSVYLDALDESLERIQSLFEPDIVFYLAGADPFVDDRLGHLNLSKQGLRTRDETVFQFFVERDIPVTFCMAGGYANDIDDIVDIHLATVCTAWRQLEIIRVKTNR